MALTKVTGQVIKNTTDVTVGVLTVTNTLAVGGTVSIGGTLTYEDVTNVDAVGLITARNGIVVGSGITLSKDGDVFFTGIATGNGSGLTALNASNLGSGTVPTARLGSGTASSSTFLRGDSSFQTITTDLVGDTSPQLGGNLDVNTKNIVFGDSGSASDDRLTFGAGTDLSIYHNGTNSVIADTGDGNLSLQTNGTDINLWNSTDSEYLARFIRNGAVELYHDSSKTAYTHGSGFNIKGGNTSDQTELQIFGNEGQDASILLTSDDGDDNADNWRMYAQASDHSFALKNYASGAYENNIVAHGNGAVELYYDNSKKFETYASGVKVYSGHLRIVGDEGGVANLDLYADEGDDAYDIWQVKAGGSSDLRIRGWNGSAYEESIVATGNGAVQLYYDNTERLTTLDDGVRCNGTMHVRSEDGNVNQHNQALYLSIPVSTTKTITLTSLLGTGRFMAGGYANAGQGAIALNIFFGGAMFGTQHYNVNVLQNSAMQNTSISLTKNGTSYVIAIANSSTSYALNLSMYLESTGSQMNYAVA